MALRSERWRFSMSASSRGLCRSLSRKTAGTRSRPASRAAWTRRSPAISRNRAPILVTTIGWSTPCSRIDAARASSSFRSKTRRGCAGLRSMLSRAISVAATSGSGRAVGEGRPPINASSPRPRPVLAMRGHRRGQLDGEFGAKSRGHLARQRGVCLGPSGRWVVLVHRPTVRGRLC